MLKSLVILVIRLAHTGTIYTQTAPLFSLNCIFSPANEEAVLKYNNQSDFKAFFEETNKIAGKMNNNFGNFLQTPHSTGSIKYLYTDTKNLFMSN